MSSGEPAGDVLVLNKDPVPSFIFSLKTTSSTPLFQSVAISHQICDCGLDNTIVVHWNKVFVNSGIFLHMDRKTDTWNACVRQRVYKINADCFGIL